jgi:hypothetical protein
MEGSLSYEARPGLQMLCTLCIVVVRIIYTSRIRIPGALLRTIQSIKYSSILLSDHPLQSDSSSKCNDQHSSAALNLASGTGVALDHSAGSGSWCGRLAAGCTAAHTA